MNKRRIIINRKKQLRSYFSHLWVVSKISRQDFRKNFLLGDLPCGEEDSAYWGMYWGLYDLKEIVNLSWYVPHKIWVWQLKVENG